ncbi:MAG: FtsW/RodA/SpoVE family cell cycle protein [Bacteroidaceae bacterium]|nr:FtsW/RodA/SpoVE family cell cycle protein [Bacteroidaceae bacterium]MBO4593524.1 FtsW/RodA/SpoVE family cell cycle protein [Bacteroidaceae bacterium]MBR4782994.1 FtsW/RodA/SpoVE family cell cycle protein [Bacteroidaceae bacterium]
MTIPNDKAALKKILSLQGDKTLWAIFFILIAISLIEVYSATSTLTFKSGDIFKPILGHAANLIVGFVCVWIFHNIPCRWFKLWLPAWVVFIAFLLFLLIFGNKVNDGARWIDIMGIRFQPSEFAKGALVVIVAILLSAYQTNKGTDKHAFKYILVFTCITCGLIVTENVSTAIILFTVVLLMMFFGRVPLKQLGKLLLVLLFSLIGFILLAKVLTTEKLIEKLPFLHRLDNFVARIDRFTGGSEADSTKQLTSQDFDINKEPQVGHARIAIAKSNILGCGPGNSRERDFLPQAYSDFIFAIIIEELGLAGGALIVLLYLILLFRASRIANRCERSFPAFVILGLAMLIVVQAAVNMCVAVGIAPVTGQPLPLVSRGGSSIMVTSIYFGMMISISRFAKKREPEAPAVEPAVADNTQPVAEEATPTVVNEEEYQK